MSADHKLWHVVAVDEQGKRIEVAKPVARFRHAVNRRRELVNTYAPYPVIVAPFHG